MNPPVVLGGGWDTINYSVHWPMPNLPVAEFDELITLKHRTNQPYWPVSLFGNTFKLVAKSGGYFILAHDALKLYLSATCTPNIKVEIHSYGVHRYEHPPLMYLVKRIARHYGALPDFGEKEKIYRADYHVDMHLDEFDYEKGNVVSYSKKIAPHYVSGKLTGICVGGRGKESVYLRVYDKLAEIEEHKAWWNEEVVKGYPGFVEGRPVIRFEVEFGGQYLRKYGIRTYENICEYGGALLRYFFNEHMRFVEPGNYNDDNRNKNRTKSEWEILQGWINRNHQGNIRDLVKPANGYSFDQYLFMKKERLLSSVTGIVALYRAYGEEPDLSSIWAEVLSAIERPDVREKTEKKIILLTPFTELPSINGENEVEAPSPKGQLGLPV
jgi:hypothetical protein